MDNPRIQDIPSIKKTLEDIKMFRLVKAAMPFLKPLLRLLKIDTDQIDKAFSNFDDLDQAALELATIPDRFNDLFSSRGWIIYELLNLDVVKEALVKAESGDMTGAEAVLVDYYSPETIRWHLRMMNALEAFHPRMRLAEKALIDYQEERYHASIPVVLALLDGFVNDIHQPKRGFFAEGVDLEAWNSVAAHSKGLTELVKVFSKGRYKTTTESIDLPYRNGILHGLDLGYANKIVAAKTWAALFATRDWAVRAIGGQLKAPPEAPKKSWSELFQQAVQSARENTDTKKRLEDWKPRQIRIGEDIPATGMPEDYHPGTPERTLVEFLAHWQARKYGLMARQLTSLVRRETINRTAGEIREIFEQKQLQAFELLDIADDAPAVTMIKTRVTYEENGTSRVLVTDFRLINEDEKGKATVRDKPGSTWTVIRYAV